MKKLLVLFLFLCSCATSNDVLAVKPTETIVASKEEPKRKYKAGDCAKFNKAAMAKKTKQKVDGTIMFILGAKRDRPGENVAVKYVVIMQHPRMKEPVEFTANIKVFDADTDKVECPK